MFDKQKYAEYLSRTRKSDGTIHEYLKILDYFYEFIPGYRKQNPQSSDIMMIEKFFAKYNVAHMETVFRTMMKCLNQYAEYTIENTGNSEFLNIAEAVKETLANRYRQKAVNFAAGRKKLIIPIPENTCIEPKYLNGIDNEDFVLVFRELQNRIVSIYIGIEASPFEWGFPDFEQTDGYYNRVADFLFGFVRNGIYKDGTLTVDTKAFSADYDVKRHRKHELVIKALHNFGFEIKNFDKKNKSFEVAYPDNDNLINVLNSYVRALSENDFTWATKEKHANYWLISKHKYSFSYRYAEERKSQKYEVPFLVELDCASETGKEVLLLIHAEASKHGYFIDLDQPIEHYTNCILYKNSDKWFLFAGENPTVTNWSADLRHGISIKAEFREAFINEKDKMDDIIRRFPESFKSNCGFCAHRKNCPSRIKYIVGEETRHACSGHSFWFENLTLKDVKDILEMFKIENKVTLT